MRADPATPEPEPAPCPKCGGPLRVGGAACAGCGLTVARMPAYIAARDAAVPDAMRDAWTRATERWDDAAAHDELLRLVVANNGYAWAAGRYRTRERDAIAEHQLERLRRAAEVTLLVSATARPDAATKPYRAATSVLAILIVLIVAGLVYATAIREHAIPAAAHPPPPMGAVRPLQPGHPVSSSTVK